MKNRALSTSRTHTSSIFRIFCKSFQHIEIGALSTHTIIAKYTVSPFFGPFWTKNGRLVNVLKWTRGPKETKMVNLSVFDHLGPFWAPLDPFGPFQTKNDFLPEMEKVWYGRGASEQNINSCLKWSKRAHMGPKGSQMVKNT